ncbi:MAG: hypothetical protein AAF211_01175, partial [Myxococcota bacterium]
GALLLPPSGDNRGAVTFEQWNRGEWRCHYAAWHRARVFAFDAFLDMFAEMDGQVVRLNPYTAEVEAHAPSLEEWAAKLLADYDFETGWSIAHAWQVQNRRLRQDERLVPRTPFVLGGGYDVDNVVAVEMRHAIGPIAELYEQLRDLPDGAQIQLHGWNPDSWAAGTLPTTSTKS